MLDNAYVMSYVGRCSTDDGLSVYKERVAFPGRRHAWVRALPRACDVLHIKRQGCYTRIQHGYVGLSAMMMYIYRVKHATLILQLNALMLPPVLDSRSVPHDG